jgi:hypothetical protein
MNWNDLLYGMGSGFQQAGGIDRLGSLAARNIAGGKYYDPLSDPMFLQEYSNAMQADTPAMRNPFIQKYSQYAGGSGTPEEYYFGKENPFGNMDMSQALNFITQSGGITPEEQGLYQNYFNVDPNALWSPPDKGYMGITDPREAYNYFSPLISGGVSWENLQPDITGFKEAGININPEIIQDMYGQYVKQNEPPSQYKGYTSFPDISNYITTMLQNGVPWEAIASEIENINQAGLDFNLNPNIYQGMYSNLNKGAGLEDYQTRTNVARNMYADDSKFGPNDIAQWGSLGFPGAPGDYYSPPEEEEPSYDYGSLGMNELAAMIMRDKNVTPEEQEIWNNSPYSKFGTPEEIYKSSQPTYDYGSLGMNELAATIMKNGVVSPEETEAWNKSGYGIFGTPEEIHSSNQPEDQIDYSKIGIGEIAQQKLLGKDTTELIEGFNEYMPGTAADINMDMVDKYIEMNKAPGETMYDIGELTGIEGLKVPSGEIDDILRAITAYRGKGEETEQPKGPMVGYDSQGRPMYSIGGENYMGETLGGYLIYEDGSPVPVTEYTEPAGYDANNQPYWQTQYGMVYENGQPVPEGNIAQTAPEEGESALKTGIDWLIPSEKSGWFGTSKTPDEGKGTKEFPVESMGNTGKAIDDLKSMAKEHYGRSLTNEEFIGLLEKLPEEKKQEILEDYGVPVSIIIYNLGGKWQ